MQSVLRNANDIFADTKGETTPVKSETMFDDIRTSSQDFVITDFSEAADGWKSSLKIDAGFGQSDTQIIAENSQKEVVKSYYSSPFNFGSQWLREYTKTIFSHTTSGYMQIDIKALQNIAYLFCYGGLRTPAFYILDLCPSGAGKSDNIRKQSDLLLSPVYKIQTHELQADVERYQKEMTGAKPREQKGIAEPKMHKCIHTNDTSKEGLFESFEAVSAQLIEFGEFGLRLKKPDPVIDYICDGYGKSSLDAPNFKNQRFKGVLKVENVSMFFIGDTNLQYLGKQSFYNHLQGGLVNRCFIVYDDYIPAFEETPRDFYIREDIKQQYNDKAVQIIRFAEQNKNFKISRDYLQDKNLIRYEATIHAKKKAMNEERNVFGNLYHRSTQNLRAIIETLHLLKCFDDRLMQSHITAETINEGIEFCKRYFDFTGIINELSGLKEEQIQDNLSDKVRNKISMLKLPCNIRVLYRDLNISKKELMHILADMGAKTDSKNILSL